MPLTPVSPPGRAATPTIGRVRRSLRVDVEPAHFCAEPCDQALTEAEIHASSEVADGLRAGLEAVGSIDVTTSVLIDDKKNMSDAMPQRRADAIARSVEELGADRVMLESELVHHLREFSAALPSECSIADGFFSRLRKRGELACSQDVTIWHALRLGLFRPVDPRWSWNVVADELAGTADVCVVILPERFRRFEEKAYVENLGALLGAPTLGERHMTLFGSQGDLDVALWAIWVDVDATDAELRRSGGVEAAELTRVLAPARVLETIR